MAKERLIVALDFPRAELALSLVDRLEGTCQWFKVGLELYLAEGNAIISELRRRNLSVFLDLKLHDIPNTVASAVRSVARLGVGMLTLHASGGPNMMTDAVEAAAQEPDAPTLLAVTVLTSMDAAQLAATGVPLDPAEQVERMAKMALDCGIPGLVASAQEVSRLRAEFGQDPILVIPGIRPHGDSAGDQKRIATPGEAISRGASYLVVGRPITRAEDPRFAAAAILGEMETAILHGSPAGS